MKTTIILSLRKHMMFFSVLFLSFGATAQNMNNSITLKTSPSSHISIDLCAHESDILIKLESGTWDTIVILGNSWTGYYNYPTYDSTMVIYGNLKGIDCIENHHKIHSINVNNHSTLEYLDCSYNNLTTLNVNECHNLKSLYCYNNELNTLNIGKSPALEYLDCEENLLTSLDISDCVSLTRLYCYHNKFDTEAFDEIMCALPDRTGLSNGNFEPLHSSADGNCAFFMECNSANAIAKNWSVEYYEDDTAIPTTNGDFDCNMLSATEHRKNTISLYPNPVESVMNISNAGKDIQILDITGRVMIVINNNVSSETQIDVSCLDKGLYFLKTDNNIHKFFKK